MLKIMADHNVEGHLQVLLAILLSPEWLDLWMDCRCEITSFDRLGIPAELDDAALWSLCQDNDVLLLTGNRNAQGDDSLESIITRAGTQQSLPVLTIGDPDRVMRDREYAEDVAAQVLQYILDVEQLRGAGRLYVP